MTTRHMSNYEVFDFYDRHSDIKSLVSSFDAAVRNSGYNQTLPVDAYGIPWPIPPSGKTVSDPVYGTVILFPDAAGNMMFIASDDSQLIMAINQAPYESNPDYLGLYADILSKAGSAAGSILPAIQWGTIALAVVLGIVLVRKI